MPRRCIEVEGFGCITGDVAWGGNWFFLVEQHGQRLDMDNIPRLTDFSSQLRQTLDAAGITGDNGAPIDHIELFDAPANPANGSRSFVL